MDHGLPSMYTNLADWFHLLTSPAEYATEAEFYRRTLIEAASIDMNEVLELGSGGGNNAVHMKEHFSMTLTDLSSDMLEVSRRINPELEHIQGDMRSLRLERPFDGVFVHDAISYMLTEDDLRAVIATAYEHLRPGGAALFAPDETTETFEARTDHGGHEGGGRAFRYLEWAWDPDPTDNTYFVEYAFLARGTDGTVKAFQDRHTCGFFPQSTWLSILEGTGFEPTMKPGIVDETAEVVFVAVKPEESSSIVGS